MLLETGREEEEERENSVREKGEKEEKEDEEEEEEEEEEESPLTNLSLRRFYLHTPSLTGRYLARALLAGAPPTTPPPPAGSLPEFRLGPSEGMSPSPPLID